MTNLSPQPDPIDCQHADCNGPVLREYPGREALLGGGLSIVRALPTRGLRMVGAWCFLDHMGPMQTDAQHLIDIGPHPHIGLQTVTWLFEGQMLHKDSLGYEQIIRPGQLNLMTAGHGIAHSEESPPGSQGILQGVQFWIALPDSQRDGPAAFEHHASLPVIERGGSRITILVGELEGTRSPATVWTPLVGAEIVQDAGGSLSVALQPTHEHALFVIDGEMHIDGQPLANDRLIYLGDGRERLDLSASAGTRAILLGGEPFGAPALLWWNFVARTTEEIEQARADWERGERFGDVTRYNGDRLSAPPLTGRLKAR